MKYQFEFVLRSFTSIPSPSPEMGAGSFDLVLKDGFIACYRVALAPFTPRCLCKRRVCGEGPGMGGYSKAERVNFHRQKLRCSY